MIGPVFLLTKLRWKQASLWYNHSLDFAITSESREGYIAICNNLISLFFKSLVLSIGLAITRLFIMVGSLNLGRIVVWFYQFDWLIWESEVMYIKYCLRLVQSMTRLKHVYEYAVFKKQHHTRLTQEITIRMALGRLQNDVTSTIQPRDFSASLWPNRL